MTKVTVIRYLAKILLDMFASGRCGESLMSECEANVQEN